jgi:hypothetical protein
MAYDVREIPTSESGVAYDGKQGTDDSLRRFTVTPDDVLNDNAERIKAFAPIPGLGSRHPNNANKVVNDIRIRQISPTIYEADISYAMPLGAGGKNQQPWEQAAKQSWSSAITEEPVDVCFDGKTPIQTVVGEQFDPPVRRPFGDLQVTVTRNTLYYDPVYANSYQFCTNSDQFFQFPAGTGLLTKWDADQIIQGDGTIYWATTIVIQFRKPKRGVDTSKAWYWRQRAEGYYATDPALAQSVTVFGFSPNGKGARCIDGFGRETSKPGLHDTQTGLQIDDPTKAQWYEFQIYESKPFSAIRILG